MSFANRVVIDETGERVFIELTAEAAVAKVEALRAEKRTAFVCISPDELSLKLSAALKEVEERLDAITARVSETEKLAKDQALELSAIRDAVSGNTLDLIVGMPGYGETYEAVLGLCKAARTPAQDQTVAPGAAEQP